MKTVLSYCLFDPIHTHGHRVWDEHRLNKERYWFNIPSLYAINKILYPDYKMKIYVNESLRYNPLFVLIKRLDIEIEEVSIPFEKTSEPMLWRMMPIWEDFDCVFSRDIDSIPNRNEFRATVYFKDSNCCIQTIRSHENHYHEQGCDMLGGLSGFKPKQILNKPKSFMEYYESRNDLPWAQDQFLMTETFLKNQDREFTESKFLDCPIDNQKRSSIYLHTTIPSDFNPKLNESQQDVLDLIDKHNICTWAGEPCDTRGAFLNEFLNILPKETEELRKIFASNTTISDFYGVDS